MTILHGKKVKLFCLGSNKKMAAEISQFTQIPLANANVSRFADGETSIDIEETVRGHHVFIVQSTSNPVNDNYMILLIMIDALKRASAKSINIVMPYYGYARQDRKARSRQPICAKLVADLIQTAGASRIITMDLHASQIQGFYNIPIDNMRGFPTISEYIEAKQLSNIVVVSPDHGGAKRARRYADNLGASIAIIDKKRPVPNVVEVMGIVGDVKGKNAIIIDDMIDTAGTLEKAAKAIMEAGANSVYAAATHAVLSNDAVTKLQSSPFKEIIVTNTIEVPSKKCIDKLTILSTSFLFGSAILNILNDKPLSGLFERKSSTLF